MLVKEFPIVLEATLNMLFDNSTLISWNTRGEEKYTQVTLRFDMNNHIDSEVKYRKMSPSKVIRDLKRAKGNQVVDRSIDCTSIVQGGMSKFDVSFESESSKSSKTEFTTMKNQNEEKYGDEEKRFLETEDTQFDHIGTINDNIVEDQIEGFQTFQENDEHSNSELEVDESIGSLNFEDGCDVENQVTCDVCQEVMECRWYRCTFCDESNICKSCYDRGCHDFHKGQMCEFICPEDIDKGGFCDACGRRFHPGSDSYCVNICQTCEDYVMCNNCLRLERHKRHLDKFVKKSVNDFFRDKD